MPNLNIQGNNLNGYYYSSIPTYIIDNNKKMYTNEVNFVTQTPTDDKKPLINNLNEINTNKKKMIIKMILNKIIIINYLLTMNMIIMIIIIMEIVFH